MHAKQFPEVEAVICKISFRKFQKEVGIYDSEGNFENFNSQKMLCFMECYTKQNFVMTEASLLHLSDLWDSSNFKKVIDLGGNFLVFVKYIDTSYSQSIALN